MVWNAAGSAEVAVLGTPSTVSDEVVVIGVQTDGAVASYATKIGSVVATETLTTSGAEGTGTLLYEIVAVSATTPLVAETAKATSGS